MTPNQSIVDTAIAISKHSNFKHKLGAVIFKRNRVISLGYNQIKSHPIQKLYSGSDLKIFMHAEIHAIVKTRDKIDGHSIIIVRQMANGLLGNSKPCPSCMAAIIASGLKNIFYYDDNQCIELKL